MNENIKNGLDCAIVPFFSMIFLITITIVGYFIDILIGGNGQYILMLGIGVSLASLILIPICFICGYYENKINKIIQR